ncbi:hypothetical protein [Pseudoduganella violaceinigra]|uniref:hypothetical protein n=1 Tax=Pseudoduganella violaceinigra TaxID=246602 RepID=UPI000550F363|nr:hypothetical protein [Pseudoduganella violaceinigra]
MSRSFRLVLCVFAFFGTFCAEAVAQDLLEPCHPKSGNPYYTGVYRVIDKAVGRPSRLQLTTFPSFQSESGIRLVDSEVYFVEFQAFFWDQSYVSDGSGVGHMDFSKPKITTKVRHAALSPPVAERVQLVFAKAIANAKESDAGGLDGTSYVFSTSGESCGAAWSPEPRSKNGRLVELMRRLERHSGFSSPIDLARSEKSLVRLLQAVESD